MPAARIRGSRLRSRPFYAVVLLLSLLTVYSFLIHSGRYTRFDSSSQDAPVSLLKRAKDLECSDVHQAEDQCGFVRQFCEDEDAGLLPYLEWYYCAFGKAKPLAFCLLVVWLGLLFTTIGIAASDFFSVNLSTIATILGLSESLAGVTFLAFGNGSPDVFSTFAAMSSNSASMAVGELLGAACFITGVVAGSMALVREFRVDRKTYARDICFFIVAVAFSTSFLADGYLRFWECWAMIGYYILYVITVVGQHWYSTRRRRRLRREGEARSHVYGVVSQSGDELAGEPYRDDPDEVGNRSSRDASRGSSMSHDISALERGPRIEIDGRDARSDDDRSHVSDDDSDSDHERLVAAEVARSMRVVRTGGSRIKKMNPIRPSLVGALEFRSALAQLQRESNLQLSPLAGRSHSDHNVTRHLRRETIAVLPESSSTPVGPRSRRNRALSSGNALPPASAPMPSLLGDEWAHSNELQTDAQPSQSSGQTTPAAYTVGGSLAPPPLGAPGSTAESQPKGHRGDQTPPGLTLQIPSTTPSEASSPSSPFPHFTDSPFAITPNPQSERTEFMLPSPGMGRRDSSHLPVMQVPVLATRPLRWWPYSVLPPPYILLATLFPTLQGWREKAIWDKILSTISVPPIFLLVITLPVVESETSEGSLDDNTVVDGLSSTGHIAPPISTEHQEIEPEGEWERYRRYTTSRRSSHAGVEPVSPRLMTLENEDTAVATASQASAAVTPSPDDRATKPLSDMPSISNEPDEPPTWNRWLVCVQLFAGPLFAVFILWANMSEEWENPGRTLVKMILYTLLGSLVGLAFLFLFTSEAKRPKYHFLLCFLGFIISIAWISTVAGEVVGVLKTFGVILGISEALLGLTIFAAGNSVGDLVADITVARLGYPVMAL